MAEHVHVPATENRPPILHTGDPAARGTGEIAGQFAHAVTRLAADEIALTRLDAQRQLKRVGRGSGLVAVAGFFGFIACACTVTAAVLGLANVMRPWAAALAVAVLAVVAAGLVGLPGLLMIRIGMRRRQAVLDDARARITDDLRTLVHALHD